MLQKNIAAVFQTTFGVPLYAEDGEGVVHDPLDHIVPGTADGEEGQSKSVDPLMVGGVYDRAQTVELVEKVISPQTAVIDRMALVVTGPLVDGGCFQILMDVAAEVDVDQLDSLADAKNGTFALYEKVKDLKLEDIQLGVDGAGAVVMLAEKGGRDVAAARKDEVVGGGCFFLAESVEYPCTKGAESPFIILCVPASSGNDYIRLRRHDGWCSCVTLTSMI